jgi:hypothetical protein
LEHLAGLVILLGVLRQVGEVGLEATHVAEGAGLARDGEGEGAGRGRDALYVFFRGLLLVALGLSIGRLADLACLALALELAYFLDEQRVDLQQRRDAVLVARLCDGRHGRGRDSLDGRLSLRGLRLDLAHGRGRRVLLLAVGRQAGGVLVLLLVVLLHMGRRIGLAGGAARGRGGLAVLGKLLVGGRGQGLRVGRGRVGLLLVLHRGCSMARQCQHRTATRRERAGEGSTRLKGGMCGRTSLAHLVACLQRRAAWAAASCSCCRWHSRGRGPPGRRRWGRPGHYWGTGSRREMTGWTAGTGPVVAARFAGNAPTRESRQTRVAGR